MNIRPCLVPALSDDCQALAFWNAALSHAEREIPVPGCDASILFRPGKPPAPKKFGHWVKLAEGPALYLTVEDFDFELWTGTDLTYSEMSPLPATIRKAIDRGILEIARRQMPEEINDRVSEIQALDPARLAREMKSQQFLWLDVTLTVEQSPIRLTAGFRSKDLPAILGSCEIEPILTGSEAFAEIPIPLRFSLGTLRLGLDELAGLEAGDLLLLEAQSGDTVFFVTAPHARYVLSSAGQDWVCSEVQPVRFSGEGSDPEDAGDEMDMETDAGENAAGETDAFGSIPVRLDFEIGKVTVPVGQLATWRPGTIVEIEPPVVDDSVEVTIRANGRRIGSGNLVRVGERLAVRLGRFASRGEIAAKESGDEA